MSTSLPEVHAGLRLRLMVAHSNILAPQDLAGRAFRDPMTSVSKAVPNKSMELQP